VLNSISQTRNPSFPYIIAIIKFKGAVVVDLDSKLKPFVLGEPLESLICQSKQA
jgi:hypothetical protein